MIAQSHILGAVLLVAALMIIMPLYNVWNRELAGKAELRQAEWNKQVLIEDAKAKKESAELLAQAEVERAKGVSESNRIIAGGLRGNTEYLKYLYITTLDTNLHILCSRLSNNTLLGYFSYTHISKPIGIPCLNLETKSDR